MGIIILTPGFPENENDTTCLPAFQQFALSLKKNHTGTDLTIIAFQYPYQKREYYWNGIPVISLGGSNKPGMHRAKTWLRAYRALKKLHVKQKINGIISLWLGECALVGNFFCKKNKVKHLIWVIGQDAKKENRYVKRISPKPETIAAMSDFLQDELFQNHGLRAAMVIPNGINAHVFPSFNSGKRAWDVVGAGWLSPLKNYRLFIDVVKELKESRPDIKAAIIGAGEEEQELRQKIKDLGLENHLELPGLLPHAQVLEIMSNATVFLHTSHYEGNSTVLMEALYCGCYVVSTQPLSRSNPKNLIVAKNKEDLFRSALVRLNDNNAKAERVVFNTMDDTAGKIMDYFF